MQQWPRADIGRRRTLHCTFRRVIGLITQSRKAHTHRSTLASARRKKTGSQRISIHSCTTL